MVRWASWLLALAPERVLKATVALGVVLASWVLYLHADTQMDQVRTRIDRELARKAALLDERLYLGIAHLQAMRLLNTQFRQANEVPSDLPRTPLFEAFLASNAGEETGRLYSLDTLPKGWPEVGVGNIAAYPTATARRRSGLIRIDPEGWKIDAALGIELMARMLAAQQTMPELRRVYFAAATGVVAYVPREATSTSPLLVQFPSSALYTAAAAATEVQPIWVAEPGGTGPTTASVALPVRAAEEFAGIMAAEIDLAAAFNRLGAPDLPGAEVLLVDRDGTVLHRLKGGEEGDDLVGSKLDLTGLERTTRSIDGTMLSIQPLERAPWLIAYAADPWALLVPVALEVAGSLGLLSGLLVLVLLVAHQVMRRAIDEREAAAYAERMSRAEAERALDDLRAAHDELDFLNREKTRFFSLVSHDLRGPFNTLLGMTQELADYAPRMKPADVQDFARSTHESARKAFDLLEDLLQWSRVQMSGKPFAPSVFPLRELVGDAVRDVQAAAESKKIQILDAVGDRWVLADRTMILAVLRNLLTNAIKFSHPGGSVQVTSRASGDRLEVAVTDQGIGLEPEQTRVMLRGGAGQQSRPGTRGETGTGLGLTLVRDLVLRHGGEMKVDGAPGKGAVVSFTVPLSAVPSDRPLRDVAE